MNTQTVATPAKLVKWNSRTFAAVETVTVGQDGNVWRWYRNPVMGLRKYGQEAFRTQAEAIDAAQSIARCYGAQYAGVEVAS